MNPGKDQVYTIKPKHEIMSRKTIFRNVWILPSILLCILVIALVIPKSFGAESIASPDKDGITELSDKGFNKIENELAHHIRKAIIPKIIGKKSFSRCPTGVYVNIEQRISIDDPYFDGSIDYSQGCSRTSVCYIRLSKNEKTLEVKKHEEDEYYMTVDQFLADEKNLETAKR